MLPVRIGLKQSNMDRMHDELMAVADPSSPSYGQHWSPQQVTDFFRPTQDTQMAVNAWLVDAGFDRQRIRLHPGGHWVEVNVTVAEAEQVRPSIFSSFQPLTKRTAP
jgi:tripeptidyl-peptidase-1